MNTLTVLESAVRKQLVPGRAAMRGLYDKLRGLDDGLPPIETTALLSPVLWT